MITKVSMGSSARSITYSPDGETLGVGLKNGEFRLLTVATMNTWAKKRERNKAITDLR